MSLDLTNTTYTYTVNEDGTVTYTAGADGVEQNLSGADLSSPDNLTAWLTAYTTAYIAGLQVEQTQIGEGIPVGQQQSGS
jgi:hypothetical protein